MWAKLAWMLLVSGQLLEFTISQANTSPHTPTHQQTGQRLPLPPPLQARMGQHAWSGKDTHENQEQQTTC